MKKARKRGEETSRILLEFSNNNNNLFTSTGMCLTDITSITLFKKFITGIMNTTGLKKALKENSRIRTIVDDESKLANYIGALLLRNYILSILRQIKKKRKKKEKKRELDLREKFFMSSEFIESFMCDIPVADKSPAEGGKSLDGSYKPWLDSIFNTNKDKWRTGALDKVGAVKQCVTTVHRGDDEIQDLRGTRLTEVIQQRRNPLCYICGRECKGNQLMKRVLNKKKNDGSYLDEKEMPVMECEHILSVLPGSGHWFLVHSSTPGFYSDEQMKYLSREYAWAHHLCNQTKSNYEFIEIGDGLEYVANDSVINYVMDIVNDDIPNRNNQGYWRERDHWNRIAPMGYDRYYAKNGAFRSDEEKKKADTLDPKTGQKNGFKKKDNEKDWGVLGKKGENLGIWKAKDDVKKSQKDAMIQYYITPLLSKINGVIRACDDTGIYTLFAKLRIFTAINDKDFTDIIIGEDKEAKGGAQPLPLPPPDAGVANAPPAPPEEEEVEQEAPNEEFTNALTNAPNYLERYHEVCLENPQDTKPHLYKMVNFFMSNPLFDSTPEDVKQTIKNMSNYLWKKGTSTNKNAESYLKSATFLNQELITLAILFLNGDLGSLRKHDTDEETAVMILKHLDMLKQSRKQYNFTEEELNNYIRSCWVILRLVIMHHKNLLQTDKGGEVDSFLSWYGMYKGLEDGLTGTEDEDGDKKIRDAINSTTLKEEQKERMLDILLNIREWEKVFNGISEEEVAVAAKQGDGMKGDDEDVDSQGVGESQETQDMFSSEVQDLSDESDDDDDEYSQLPMAVSQEDSEAAVLRKSPVAKKVGFIWNMKDTDNEPPIKAWSEVGKAAETPMKKKKKKSALLVESSEKNPPVNPPGMDLESLGGGGRRKKTRHNKKDKRKISKNKKHKRKTKKGRRKKNRKQTYRKRR